MSSAVYTKLAFTNLKNNRKMYFPYIFTSIITVMMYYIIHALSMNKSIGEETLRLLLQYACGVMVVFSVIFLFYTNSFLIRQRKREVGVYNILGMEKRHISRMLAIETIFTGLVSIGAGLLCGIVFSRLMWLILLKIIHYDVRMGFEISGPSVFQTVLLYGVIFFVTLLYNLLQIRLSNPIELLRSARQGEKEPKTRWLLALIGVAAVGCGYVIAFITEEPLQALANFFIAVVCVIVGTYALFIAGSIALLKLLRKKKSFYYKAKNFTAVSGMLYRMKQNAAGLANICILSTMVLVMLSTTVSLYVGMEDVLKTRFPSACEIEDRYWQQDPQRIEKIRAVVDAQAAKKGIEVTNVKEFRYGALATYRNGNVFTIEGDGNAYSGLGNAYELYMLSQEDYNRMEGKHISLQPDEVLLYSTEKDGEKFPSEEMVLEGTSYRIVEELDDMRIEKKSNQNIIKSYYVVMADIGQIDQHLLKAKNDVLAKNPDFPTDGFQISYRFRFDLKGEKADCIATEQAIKEQLASEVPEAEYQSREMSRESFYSLYGGLLFIGIYLGVLFLIATVLIIYYKQISEGYEDKERYQIMQKVGMSRREVIRSIKSQVLLVFFLPLLVAVIHIAAAFKTITKILAVLNLVNVPLFFLCTVASVLAFAIFYAVVYTITAREYYRIVK